uniref:ZP-C domain-containing protein n=1 Tax=Hucho hucho TaxID=62062 RepID=A0A4W5JVC4_9TELE
MGLRVDFVGFVVLVSFSYAQSLLFPIPSRNQEASNFVSYGPQQQAEEPVSTDSRIPTQYLFRAIQTAMPFEQRIPVQIPVQTEHGKPAPSPVQFEYRNPVQKPTQGPVKSEPPQPARKQQAFQPGKPPVHGQVLNHMVKEEPKELVKFELKNPVSATSVAVQCREDVVQVEVKQDFLGKEFLKSPMGKNEWWKNNWNYLTARFYGYYDTSTVGLYFCFSVSSLSDDWQFERPSSVYFLGHVMSIAASIIQAHHTTLHVYVDSCVATLAPEMASEPRYSFIENRSKSHFLQQTQDDKLQLQLEAFRFHQDERSSSVCTVLLSCSLAGGDDLVCDCCDSTCGLRKGRSLPTDNVFHQSHL